MRRACSRHGGVCVVRAALQCAWRLCVSTTATANVHSSSSSDASSATVSSGAAPAAAAADAASVQGRTRVVHLSEQLRRFACDTAVRSDAASFVDSRARVDDADAATAATTAAATTAAVTRPRRRLARRPHRYASPHVAVAEATCTTTTMTTAVASTQTAHNNDDEDDDVVVTMPSSLQGLLASATTQTAMTTTTRCDDDGDGDSTLQPRRRRRRQATHSTSTRAQMAEEAAVLHNAHVQPATATAACGVGQDVIDLVTDAMRVQREREVRRRRRVLYELTHPRPQDYTYGTRLVPPPPLNFGVVTDEAIALGRRLMLEPTYTLVRQAGLRASDTDVPPPRPAATTQDSTVAWLSTTATVAPHDGMHTPASPASRTTALTTSSSSPSSLSPLPPRHHGRKRDENAFAGHNLFFEVNELYQEIVLIGRASAGKSSLLNALLGQDVAKTSSTPHTTRAISFYQSVTPQQLSAFYARERHQLVTLPGGGLQLTFVDVPGFGLAGMHDAWRDAAIALTDAYLGVRRSVNTVLFCLDCARGLTHTDMRYFRWLENVQGVFFVVLTKCDSVSHARLCAVMRQLYVLITRQRRKYRKVYPFVLPTSAHDGTNMDVLRGLLAETSGMVAGDRLRALLKRKQAAVMRRALRAEATRLQRTRQLEREQARAYFATAAQRDKKKSNSNNSNSDNSDNNNNHRDDASSAARRVYELTLCSKDERSHDGDDNVDTATTRRSDQPVARDTTTTTTATAAAATPPPPRPRRTTATHYGDTCYSVNTGLDGHRARTVTIAYDGDGKTTRHTDSDHAQQQQQQRDDDDDEHGTTGAPPAAMLAPAVTASRVIGVEAASSHTRTAAVATRSDDDSNNNSSSSSRDVTTATTRRSSCGVVSAFLDSLDHYAQHTNDVRRQRRRRRQCKQQQVQQQQQQHKTKRPSSRLLLQRADGRLAEHTAGRATGVALLSPHDAADTRHGAWRTRQLATLLQREDARAPWAALPQLARKLDAQARNDLTATATSGQRGGGGSSTAVTTRARDAASSLEQWQPQTRRQQRRRARAEARAQAAAQAAYERNAGRIVASFAKFEDEVRMRAYRNESRQAPTLRSQAQMHLNATARISYAAMPPGLLKQYGQMDTHWPTPRVRGREHDESHRRG